MKRYSIFVFVFIVVVSVLFFTNAIDKSLHTTYYQITSEKIKKPVRFAVLTDLHSGSFGENQSELMSALLAEKPDAAFFVGDIFDERFPTENAFIALTESAKNFPTYYTTGNHEYKRNKKKIRRTKEFLDLVKASGTKILSGNCVALFADFLELKICGVDDPVYIGKKAMCQQLSSAVELTEKSDFTILLAHRPELLEIYGEYGFDLVLSGHAHGGQWRLPGLIEGVYASGQGLFPSYTSGKYFYKNTTLVLSRGLARKATIVPRFFNPLEIVFIELLPN